MRQSAIADRFRRTCVDRASATAVYQLADGAAVSFADLLAQFELVSRSLAALGVTEGDCVISRVGNRALFIPTLAAVLDAGAALLPVGEITDAELGALMSASGAAIGIADRPLPDGGASIEIEAPIRATRLAPPTPRAYRPSTVIKLTSGSTDLPKAALAGEAHLINDGRHVMEGMGITGRDVNLGYIPLSHSYALGNIVMPLVLEGTAVALRPLFNPSSFADDVVATAATVFPGVPFMFDHIRQLAFGGLPRGLRLLITAGARIDRATVAWFRDRLDRKVHSFYGSSETGGIAYDDSEDVGDPLPVGRALPETRMDIRSGRVFVTGNAVVSGYAGTPPGDESPFCGGGFLTADLGHLDERGQLFLTGRASALVNVAGLKVDPSEVERTLTSLPDVGDARVLGIADERRGQQLVAVIVRRHRSATAVQLRQQCAATLSPHKIPRRFVFVDALPVDARGKTDRRALERLATGIASVPTGDSVGQI